MQIERLDPDGIHENRTSVLKEYYSRYLTEIRGLKDSSVRHYLDALNKISRRLKSKDIVKTDIYEIMDLNELTVNVFSEENVVGRFTGLGDAMRWKGDIPVWRKQYLFHQLL